MASSFRSRVCLGLPLGAEAPAMTPKGKNLSFQK